MDPVSTNMHSQISCNSDACVSKHCSTNHSGEGKVKAYSKHFKVIQWKVKSLCVGDSLRFINSQSMSYCIRDTLAPQASTNSNVCFPSGPETSFRVS